MLEFGDGQETAISEIFEAKGWRDLEVLKDLTQRPRMLIAQPPR
jgi:methylase of polypeptide subunit release factors